MLDNSTEARLAAIEHMVSFCVSRIMKASAIQQDLDEIADNLKV
jgi:hypothetical protein